MKLAVIVLIAACTGTVPDTHYYQLAPTTAATPPHGDRVLAVDSFTTDGPYDDERIVYRTTPYRLDYYQYHQWSAAPGAMIGAYLRDALARTGAFHAVVRDSAPGAGLVLGGRIIAIEELDQSPSHWVGRLAIQLTLTDAKSGNAVWTQTYDETEPLQTRTPEGLASALSIVMTRIVPRVVAAIAELRP
jgi:uncharacterized lipoprotein YmbA